MEGNQDGLISWVNSCYDCPFFIPDSPDELHSHEKKHHSDYNPIKKFVKFNDEYLSFNEVCASEAPAPNTNFSLRDARFLDAKFIQSLDIFKHKPQYMGYSKETLALDAKNEKETFGNMNPYKKIKNELLNNAEPTILPRIDEKEDYEIISDGFGTRGRSAVYWNNTRLRKSGKLQHQFARSYEYSMQGDENAATMNPAILDFTGKIFKDCRNRNVALITKDILGSTFKQIMKPHSTRIDVAKAVDRLLNMIMLMTSGNSIPFGFSLFDLVEAYDEKGKLRDHFKCYASCVLEYDSDDVTNSVGDSMLRSPIWKSKVGELTK